MFWTDLEKRGEERIGGRKENRDEEVILVQINMDGIEENIGDLFIKAG